MALRVRVELIPHGHGKPEILDDITIVNNGTGEPGGRDEGGVGNYDIYEAPIERLHKWARADDWDAVAEAKVGEIRDQERTPGHRTRLAELALAVVQEGRKG